MKFRNPTICRPITPGFAILLTLAIGTHAVAATPPKDATPEETEQARKANLEFFSKQGRLKPNLKIRPVPDVSPYKYLLMNSVRSFEPAAKEVITRNLPADVNLVILTGVGKEKSVRQEFGKWIAQSRLFVATDSTYQTGFWSRDSFPVPTFTSEAGDVSLVWAKYYQNFEGGKAVAQAVKSRYTSEKFTFVGGNLMADEDGNCFVVDSSRRFDLPTRAYEKYYGCRTVTFLPHFAGIGDIDEVLKLLPGKQALTQIASYIPVLEKMGYTVTNLPDPGGYRTYANSVILNGTVFVPSYGGHLDQEASKVYERFGYHTVLVPSTRISDEGHGSLHCITMTYPEIPLQQLLEGLGARLTQLFNTPLSLLDWLRLGT